MSPEEAARRRDFTINAISWDPLDNVYVDPCEGRADIVTSQRIIARRAAQTGLPVETEAPA